MALWCIAPIALIMFMVLAPSGDVLTFVANHWSASTRSYFAQMSLISLIGALSAALVWVTAAALPCWTAAMPLAHSWTIVLLSTFILIPLRLSIPSSTALRSI